MIANEALRALRAELEAMAPNNWQGVLRSVSTRTRVTELLEELDRPPTSYSRLGWELREQLRTSIELKEAA